LIGWEKVDRFKQSIQTNSVVSKCAQELFLAHNVCDVR
jgi:hypothetical protein